VIPGKNERDPLDDWLERDVQLLMPPSGTFDHIAKRAGRRKWRTLLVVLVSAATVATAAVFAVPALVSLHKGHATISDTHVANGHSATPSPSGTSGTPTPSSQPSGTSTVSPSGAVAADYPAGGAVPANFQPASVTFVGANTGWAIGQAGTPGTCANADPTICTSMVETRDGGRTWKGVPAPSTKAVTGVRFLEGKNGWAYGPQLWSTHDYGNHWANVNTGGKAVIDLETAGTQAFAIFATCGDTSSSYAVTNSCKDYTLEETAAATDAWSPVGPATTGLSEGGNAGSWATLVLSGNRGWLLGPDDSVYSGSLAGGPWQRTGSTPCTTTRLMAWLPGIQSLATACDSGAQSPVVYSSGDDGSTWTPWKQGATLPGSVTVTSVAGWSAPIVATTAGIDILDASTEQWQQVASLQGGFRYVGMTSASQGVAVPANMSLHEIWMTSDGGITWRPIQLLP